jgi:hypothetical protein
MFPGTVLAQARHCFELLKVLSCGSFEIQQWPKGPLIVVAVDIWFTGWTVGSSFRFAWFRRLPVRVIFSPTAAQAL